MSSCAESCTECNKSADSFSLPSSDSQGETLEQLNSPCPWMLASASDDDEVGSIIIIKVLYSMIIL